MPSIRVFAFQPFESRIGIDTVLALSFDYPPQTVAGVKAAIQHARYSLRQKNLGGWLPEHRSWFCERNAWPIVRQRLVSAGYLLIDDAGDVEPDPEPRYSPPADVRGVIKSWYREMAMRYHPDRTLDNGAAMKAVNHGYERLQELLGITR